MNSVDELQEEKEEADLLRKRSWDFIDKLDKLENQQQNTSDNVEYKALGIRIENTKNLLDEYRVKYEAFCEKSGISKAFLIPSEHGINPILKRKTNRTHKNLIDHKKTTIQPFFDNTVPPRNRHFTDRQSEIKVLIEKVLAGDTFSIVGLKGMGGIGKTELAKEICHLFHETWKKKPELPGYIAGLLSGKGSKGGFFRDGVLWIQFKPKWQTPKSLTEDLIAKLISSGMAKDIKNLSQLADILADKDVLVVLDSVEQNMRTFDYVLERFKGKFPLIITSRIAIPGIDVENIDSLDKTTAEALFISHLVTQPQTSEQKKAITELCQLLGNYPLIIKIIASHVAVDNSNLMSLKEKYQQNRSLLLKENNLDSSDDTRHIDVKTCFKLSVNQLGSDDKKIFLHAALFNNPFTVSSMAALLNDAEEAKIQSHIETLLRLSLINSAEDAEDAEDDEDAEDAEDADDQQLAYDLHPLMREFALDLLMKNASDDPDKLQQINHLLIDLRQLAKDKGALLLRLKSKTDRQQLVTAVEYCDQIIDFDKVLDFVTIVDQPLDQTGYWEDKIRLSRLAVRAAVALQNPAKEAYWRKQFADTLIRKNESEQDLIQARKMLLRALAIEKALRLSAEVLSSQYKLARIEKDLQQWTAAVTSNYRGIRKACRYGNFVKLSGFIKSLGEIHKIYVTEDTELLCRLNFALKAGDLQNDITRWNLLNAYQDLARVMYKKGQYVECIPYYEMQFRLSRALPDKELVASSLECLFKCHRHLQQPEACQKYLTTYIEYCKLMKLPASRYQRLSGRLAWLRKDYSAAIADFSKALSRDKRHCHEYYYWLGKCHLYNNNLADAKTFFDQALRVYRQHESTLGIAKVYNQFALLAYKNKDIKRAVKYFFSALKTQEKLGIQISPEELQIQKDILAAMKAQQSANPVKTALYKQLMKNASAITLKPDFLLDDLPDNYLGKDNKPMLLIPIGPAFIGEGAIKKCTVQQQLKEVEQYLYPGMLPIKENNPKKRPQYQFDQAQMKSQLDKIQYLESAEKQQILTEAATCPASKIPLQMNQLKQKHLEIHPEASEIYLYHYYVDKDLVSNAEYQLFCEQTDHPAPSHWPNGTIAANEQQLPVVNISLKEAKAYARWAGKKIPTAAEWEKACRGDKGQIYPWGNDWDERKVKAKDGSTGRRFEAEYLELNKIMPEEGGIVHFRTVRLQLISQQFNFNEKAFVNYLQGSVSVSFEEKQRIIENLDSFEQVEMEEFLDILYKEKSSMQALDYTCEKGLNEVKRICYLQHMEPELAGLYHGIPHQPQLNTSPYGIQDMVGSVYQMTVTERDDEFLIKGGSWFSQNPEQACQAWHSKTISETEKRMDVGFRCVKPIFAKGDLPSQ